MVIGMSPSVSVPEKTLEHWASQYVTYRYRSKAALWWPAKGEDLNVRWLPIGPGKAVQLELKTTTVSGHGLQDVFVDLGQLWSYLQQPLGHQPFYAFPYPDWRGSLTAAAVAGGRQVTELAFARSGPGWWFADWMVVMTAAQVAEVLRGELVAHGCAARSKTCLVRFDLRHSTAAPKLTWGSHAPAPNLVAWRDFWATLEQCGQDRWPQLIMVPTWLARPGVRYSRQEMIALVREAAIAMRQGDMPNQETVTLEPDEEGGYQVAANSDAEPNEPEDQLDETDARRLVVFLNARALLRAG